MSKGEIIDALSRLRTEELAEVQARLEQLARERAPRVNLHRRPPTPCARFAAPGLPIRRTRATLPGRSSKFPPVPTHDTADFDPPAFYCDSTGSVAARAGRVDGPDVAV